MAAQPATLEVRALNPVVEANPGQPVVLLVSLTYQGPAPLVPVSQPEVPVGWRVLVPLDLPAMDPGTTVATLFALVVPAHQPSGEYPVTVRILGGRSARGGRESDGAGQNLSPRREVHFTVRVRSVRRLEAELLEGPRYAIARPYALTFGVRNDGNTSEEVLFRIQDSLALPARVIPESVYLVAGGVATVRVLVDVPRDWPHATTHRPQLVAQSTADSATRATAFAAVELIPRTPPEAVTHHLYPMRLSLAWEPTKPSRSVRFGVSGNGPVTDTDPGRLSLSVSEQRATLGYQGADLALTVGYQRFGLFVLTQQAQPAPGAQLTFQPQDWSAQVYAHAHELGTKWGVGLGYLGHDSLQPSVQLLTQPARNITILSGRVRWLMPWGHLDAEQAFQAAPEPGPPLQATWLGGLVQHGSSTLVVAEGKYEPPGYVGERGERRSLGALASVALGAGLRLDASGRQWRQYEPGMAEPLARLTHDARLALTMFEDPGQWMLEYRLNETLNRDAQVDVLGHHVRIQRLYWPQANRLATVALSGRRELDRRHGAVTDAGTAEFRWQLLVHNGAIAPLVAWEHTFRPEPADAWRLGASVVRQWSQPWRTELTGEVRLARVTRYVLGGSVQYRTPLGSLLDSGVRVTWAADGKSELQARVAYSVPFDVPLGRLSDVAEVSGRVVDEAGSGIPDMVVQLNGLATATQEGGRFLFPAVTPGVHFLTLRQEQLGPSRIAVPALPRQINVAPGQRVEETLQIVRAGRVQGQLRLRAAVQNTLEAGAVFGRGVAKGQLVAGVVVELAQDATVLRSVSDDRGRFSFEPVPPGRWELRVRLNGLHAGYDVRPQQLMLKVEPGETATVSIQVVPKARTVRFEDGGRLLPEDGEAK